MDDDDRKLFRDSIQGTKPLEQDKHVLRPAKKSKPIRQTEYNDSQPSYIDPESFSKVGAEEALFYAKPHLNTKQLRQLRQGKIPLQATLDLHGMNLAQAESALNHFLTNCQQLDKRYALIIHGKGGRNPQNQAILKSFVYHYLQHEPKILALCSATTRHGGTGALYILIKCL